MHTGPVQGSCSEKLLEQERKREVAGHSRGQRKHFMDSRKLISPSVVVHGSLTESLGGQSSLQDATYGITAFSL
jgi:hypothetical protein